MNHFLKHRSTSLGTKYRGEQRVISTPPPLQTASHWLQEAASKKPFLMAVGLLLLKSVQYCDSHKWSYSPQQCIMGGEDARL